MGGVYMCSIVQVCVSLTLSEPDSECAVYFVRFIVEVLSSPTGYCVHLSRQHCWAPTSSKVGL